MLYTSKTQEFWCNLVKKNKCHGKEIVYKFWRELDFVDR